MYLLIGFVLLLQGVHATLYVNNPEDCGTEYQSQSCLNPGEVVCGYYSSTTYCYDNASIVPPASVGYSTSNPTGSFDGGYVLDCHSYTAPEPYCMPAVCDRASSCYNINRQTNCTANTWTTYVCGSCISGYQACDGSISDGDGCEIDYGTTSYPGEDNAHYDDDQSCNPECNSGYLDCDTDLGSAGTGCEILDGGSCEVGGLSGSYNGCSGCEVDPVSYGVSGVKQEWSGSLPFLWFKQYSLTGWIFNATNFYNKTIGFTNNSCLYLNGTEYCGNADFGGGTDTNESTRVNYLYTHWLNDSSTASGDVTGLFSALTVSDDSHTHACGNITGATSDLCTIVDTNTYNNTEQVQDAVGVMAGSHLTYNDATNDLSVDDDWYDAVSDFVSPATDERVCTYEATGTLIDCDGATTGSGSFVKGTSPTIGTPLLTLSTTASTTSGRIRYDSSNDWVMVGDGSTADSFMPVTSYTDEYLCSYESTGTTLVCDIQESWVEKSGDTMTGNLNMSYHNITNTDCIVFNNGAKICGI